MGFGEVGFGETGFGETGFGEAGWNRPSSIGRASIHRCFETVCKCIYEVDGSLDAQVQVRKISQVFTCVTYLCATTKPESIGKLIELLKSAEGFPDRSSTSLQLSLTIPIANIAAERSFSTLHQIMTYLRGTINYYYYYFISST